ncbi:MAG: hypothetical protein ACREIC_26960, partial [Limisphaerales bacterium]
PTTFPLLSAATQAVININLVSRSAVESDRVLLIALSSTNQYAISTNASICAARLPAATNGVYVGSLSFSNGLFIGSQPVKMAVRAGQGGTNLALFDVTGNAFFGNTFTVPVVLNPSGFQFAGGYSATVTNTPFGRPVGLALNFGATQQDTNNIAFVTNAFVTPVTLTVTGLTASGRGYSGQGRMTLSRSQ